RDIVQGQRNVLFYLVSRAGHHVTKPHVLVFNGDDMFELSPTDVEVLILIAHLDVGRCCPIVLGATSLHPDPWRARHLDPKSDIIAAILMPDASLRPRRLRPENG